MHFKVYERKEFLSGWLFIVLGAATAWYARRYEMGTLTEMGPGYFPVLMAALLAGLGVLAVLRGLRPQAEELLEPWHVAPAIYITAGVVCFGLLVDAVGLVPAVAAMVLLGCGPRCWTRPVEALLLAAGTAGVATGLFIYVLGLPLKPF